MSVKTVAQKARVKPGTRIAALNPVAGIVESLGLPEDTVFVEPAQAQLVFLFVNTRSELVTLMPPAELVGIGDEVDGSDEPAVGLEGERRDRVRTFTDDDRWRAVEFDDPCALLGRRPFGDRHEETDHPVSALHGPERCADLATTVGDEDDVGGQDLDESLDITGSGSSEEAFRELPMRDRVRRVTGPAFGHVLASPVRELAHSGLLAADHLSDGGVLVVERLAEDEDGPLERAQRLEHEEEASCQRLRELGVLRWVSSRNDGLGQPRPREALPACSHPTESIDGQPRGDGGQEGARFLDRSHIQLEPAQPRVLDHVLGIAHATEHAIGDAHQVPPLLGERRGGGLVRHRGSVAWDRMS
jgi:hypothetical protein